MLADEALGSFDEPSSATYFLDCALTDIRN